MTLKKERTKIGKILHKAFPHIPFTTCMTIAKKEGHLPSIYSCIRNNFEQLKNYNAIIYYRNGSFHEHFGWVIPTNIKLENIPTIEKTLKCKIFTSKTLEEVQEIENLHAIEAWEHSRKY